MGRIHQAASQVAETASVVEQIASQAATSGLRLTGAVRLFSVPGWASRFVGQDAGSVSFDLVVRIADQDPQSNEQDQTQRGEPW